MATAAAAKRKPTRRPTSRTRSEPTVYNIHQAKTHLSRLLQRVAAGETIVIAKANRPLARLAPLLPPRQLGSARGQIWISPDFDAPDPELEADFYGWDH